VLLSPNFTATVLRHLYEDRDHPGRSFVDLTEYTGEKIVF
jgi:hypothetical protein